MGNYRDVHLNGTNGTVKYVFTAWMHQCLSLKTRAAAASSTGLRFVYWMKLVGGWMNPSPVLVFWAKSAWWGPEPSACARWQLGERVPSQASAALALVLWPPPLSLGARHQHFWPADWSWSTCSGQFAVCRSLMVDNFLAHRQITVLTRCYICFFSPVCKMSPELKI